MCTADNIIVPTKTSNHTRLFAMKLFPRCNANNNNSSNATSTSSIIQPRRQLHREDNDAEMTSTATPRASGRGVVRARGDDDHLATIGASMRRCQSANSARRPRSIVAGMREHSMHKSRSHSQEPTSCHNNGDDHHYNAAFYQTQELPIPARRGVGWGGNGNQATAVAASSPDKTGDLTRMYDYATWNMYERIVNARRRRLSQLDVAAQQGEESSPVSSSSSSQSARRANESQVTSSTKTDRVANTVAAATTRQKKLSSILLHKNSSNDSSSTDNTMATADETDKSSTTSSSWSRTDSPHTFPGVSAYLMDPHRGVSSCPPPDTRGGGDDDHFIFEMDM